MERRTALQLLGTFVAVAAGTAVASDDEYKSTSPFKLYSGPHDYIFHTDGIKNIVIKKGGGGEIVIPFAEVVEALEKQPADKKGIIK